MAASSAVARRLWTCSSCARRFANRNQVHTCAPLDLDHHFEGRGPEARALFDAFVAAVRALGPVTVLPEKTRIAFQTRMSFAQLTPRKDGFSGHLVLARAVTDVRFHKVETFSRRNHVHHFRLRDRAQLDAAFLAFLAEAYAVGNQEHLTGRGRGGRATRR